MVSVISFLLSYTNLKQFVLKKKTKTKRFKTFCFKRTILKTKTLKKA